MSFLPANKLPCTIWLTGLPCSGKSTIAQLLHQKFLNRKIPSIVLDGDDLRSGLNKDLDFSDSGRKESVRRAVEVSKLLMNAGVFVIVALISPFEEDRVWAKDYLGEENFLLAYVNCPLNICRDRDIKGLYQKAKEGIIKNFTGVDSLYEIPSQPNIILDTHLFSPATSTDHVWCVVEKSKLRAIDL